MFYMLLSCLSIFSFGVLGYGKMTNGGEMNGQRVTPPPPPVRQYSPLSQTAANKSTSISMKYELKLTKLFPVYNKNERYMLVDGKL